MGLRPAVPCPSPAAGGAASEGILNPGRRRSLDNPVVMDARLYSAAARKEARRVSAPATMRLRLSSCALSNAGFAGSGPRFALLLRSMLVLPLGLLLGGWPCRRLHVWPAGCWGWTVGLDGSVDSDLMAVRHEGWPVGGLPGLGKAVGGRLAGETG